MVKNIKNQSPPIPASSLSQTASVTGARVGDVKSAQTVGEASEVFAGRLLDAATARDVDQVKQLVTSWTNAQSNYEALTEGLLALSNFLRVFGSGEQDPKLYANILSLEAPKDAVFDAASAELGKAGIAHTGALLSAVEDLAAAIGKGHLDGSIDIHAGEAVSLKNLLIANNLGLNTDALKVKMAGWNKLTPKLDQGKVSFELGIRKLPRGSNTNFWVIGGTNKVVEWIKNLRISPDAVEWMKGHDLFKGYPKAFFEYFTPKTAASGKRVPGGESDFEKDLKAVKIEALADGEVYAGGPIMRVSGPPAAVEFLESNIMRLVTSWTTVATAASQMTNAADGKGVAYFGPRRAPGGDDTTTAISDAAAIGGMTVTSDLMGGFLGNPITGTMEHSIMLMLKTVFKHDPPREFTAAEKADAGRLLESTWRSSNPEISSEDLKAKVAAQLDDVLSEAYIFQNYSMKYDGAKSVALVDTSHPNVGVAASMLAQKWAWAENGKSPENNLFAIRIDSGNLLAQGLQFHRAMRENGMEHIKILATDGLLPETVKFFEKLEDVLHDSAGGQLSDKFYEMVKAAPESVAETDEEKQQIIQMGERLARAGGLPKETPLFAAYGAGEKIADSVSTTGRPGIVYKASELTFEDKDGQSVTVNMGKIPTPDKATGPNRDLVAKIGADGKIEQYVIVAPDEVNSLGQGWQRLMRTVFEDGTIKANTSHKAAIEHAAQRRGQLPDSIKDGATVPIGMSKAYKDAWAGVVKESDPTREQEFRAYFDKMWPTVDVSG